MHCFLHLQWSLPSHSFIKLSPNINFLTNTRHIQYIVFSIVPCTAAAAARSLQSCPALWDPIDGQPARLLRPWDSPGKNTGVGCHFLLQCIKVKVKSFSRVRLFTNPMDYSLPGSSVYGIFQARVLEWVAISFSRRSSQPGDWTQVSRIVGRGFTVWGTREILRTPHAHCQRSGFNPWLAK